MTQGSTGRRVVANIALTLDGRMSGPGGARDMAFVMPHAFSDQVRDHMAATHRPATTVLLGRENAEGFATFWPLVAEDVTADPRDRAFAQWLNVTEKVIFSSTTTTTGWDHARVVDAHPAKVVEELRRRPGGDIVVLASASIIVALLEADAVDRLSITLCPEVAGGGRRLFQDGLPASSWTLHSVAASDTGALTTYYDRAGRAAD